ncbi:MAG TPA: helix-turn-helix transcriptional regulator [Gammaproteobacteria bacterium]|nr:helix-turn-helix transcriptional regulator [Gammaproteobacteria bacterium]
MSPFGALLRYYRELSGLSQEEIAHQLSLDSKTISAIETGRRKPPPGDQLRKLSAALKLTPDESQELVEVADNSNYVLRIPRDVSPRTVQALNKLVKSSYSLECEQVAAIEAMLERR